jgi:hypothetical protein
LLLSNVLLCQDELQILFLINCVMSSGPDVYSESHPLADIREAAVTVLEEVRWSRPGADVVVDVGRYLKLVE